MQCKPWKLAPTAIPASITNIVNPPTLTGGVGVTETKTFIILTQVMITNKDSVARTLQSYIGLTGASTAGTEFLPKDLSIPANSSYTWTGRKYLKTTDFLTMIAGTVTTLVCNMDGEIGVAD